MPTDAAIDIEPMTAADVGAGTALVAEAGWNQTEADWQTMLTLGHGFCVRDAGRAIATSLVLPYEGFGWISMVLVATPFRGRGIATVLLRNAIAMLQGRGLTPMLDATPAGRRVYEPLGFVAGPALSRWRGSGLGNRSEAQGHDLDAAIARDANTFGAPREKLLRALAARSLFLTAPRGCLFTRPGRTAAQIGPLIADTPRIAVDLVVRALDHIAGPVLIDVPDREAHLTAFLRAADFSIERPFTRMALGTGGQDLDRAATLRAIAGPELG